MSSKLSTKIADFFKPAIDKINNLQFVLSSRYEKNGYC
jgi:hypothetical protein